MIFSEKIFHRVVALAKKGRGSVSPNPEVGCVVVKNGKILGEGFHENFGEAHAEVNAIKNAEISGFSVEDSEVFVSLEPCSHTCKKTPPCADLLIAKKIKKVLILHKDPNPEVSGKGAEKLQKSGIEVIWAEEKFPEIFEQYQDFYKKFAHWIQKKTPYITLKWAQSQDGFLGKKGEQTKISGKECREYTLDLRDKYQAILVGSNTVLIDNPTLDGKKTSPLRIILDGKNRLSSHNYHVFRDKNFLHITGEKTIPEIQKILKEKNIASVLVEGGAITAQKFLDSSASAVQKCVQYTAPFSLKNGVSAPKISEISGFVCQEKILLGEDLCEVFEKK